MTGPTTNLSRRHGCWAGEFVAMASPCEILIDTENGAMASRLVRLAWGEAARIEQKFSRYREDSVVHRIHSLRGAPIEVDEETASLLDFAGRCFDLSGERFDVTCGVLRRVWTFDGSSRLPDPSRVAALLPLIGWRRVTWSPPSLTLPEGMEIDLGGIGKEYAVDRVLALLADETDAPLLVNFGGDLRVSGPRSTGGPWKVGIDDPRNERTAVRRIELSQGALATSGDTRRYLERDGVRYSHVLDPRTGWPVPGAPRSVTVAAATCSEAGMLATFAMLFGDEAERFLEQEKVVHWCLR